VTLICLECADCLCVYEILDASIEAIEFPLCPSCERIRFENSETVDQFLGTDQQE
jgi:hypothetical protein